MRWGKHDGRWGLLSPLPPLDLGSCILIFSATVYKKYIFLVDINNLSKFHKLSLVFTPVGFQNFSSISIWKFKVTIWGYFTHSYNTCIIMNTWEIYKQPVIADIYHCKPYVNTYTCIFILRILNRITSWKQNLTNCSSVVNQPFIWIWNGTWNIWFTGSTERAVVKGDSTYLK